MDQSSHFEICIYRDELECFWKNKRDFIQKYQKSHTNLSQENIYSLLLNTAIVLEQTEIVRYILQKVHSQNLLTHVDGSNYSPISNALNSGNKDILELVKKYIKNHEIVPISTIDPVDYENLLTLMKFPQFEEITLSSYYNDYLVPLYSKESLNGIADLIGELGE